MPDDGIAIIGAGYEGFRPVVTDLSTREMMFQAASKAYEDAGGIDPRRDVGSFICCTEDLWEGCSITDEMIPDQIGGAQRPVCTIPSDAITGLGNAVMQIRAGVADVVVLEAHSKTADVLSKNGVEALAQEPSLIRPLGLNNDALAALEMSAFLRASGYKMDDLDSLIEDEKKRALKNPRASFGAGVRDIDKSKVLASPLRRIDRAPFAEACVVLVLSSERWMRRSKKKKKLEAGIYVDGVSWCSSLPWFDGGDFLIAEYARRAFLAAKKQAGLRRQTLADFDILELDDVYSYKLLQHLHSISGSKKDEKLVLSGDGPALNPSGGSLGAGNLIEACAAHRLLECVYQLRGKAGELQVNGARRALVQSWRGVPTATGGVAILSSR